jgi:hypothetical protein
MPDDAGAEDLNDVEIPIKGRRVVLDCGKRSVFVGKATIVVGDAIFDGVTYDNIIETIGPTGRTIRLALSDEAIDALKAALNGEGMPSETTFKFRRDDHPPPGWVWVQCLVPMRQLIDAAEDVKEIVDANR